jgi:hypothetical protein
MTDISGISKALAKNMALEKDISFYKRQNKTQETHLHEHTWLYDG